MLLFTATLCLVISFMQHKKYLITGLVALSFLLACGDNTQTNSAPESPETKTEALFTARCGMCHGFKEDKIGPALAGVQQRWGGDTEKLKAFIRNSQTVIGSGDPYAVALYEKWNKSAMPSFNDISEADMNALVDYLK